MNMVAELKHINQDFEFYPTTQEIIAAFHQHAHQFEISSLLDVGAGNGKVLLAFKALTKQYERPYHTDLFSIEKASPLLDSLPIDVSILGTDFWEQSLLDKSIDCLFSNPPYSEFVDWSVKLIREANSNFIYLVIPQRWKEQKPILNAIKARQADYKIIGSFDFLESEDRKARAKVDLVFIQLRENSGQYSRRGGRENNENAKVDSFELWVKDYFGIAENVSNKTVDEWTKKEQEAKARDENLNNALVAGNGLIETLHKLYNAELNNLLDNYKKVCSLDAELFLELDISIKSVVLSLRTRIKGLKDAYWQELFNNYKPLTERLTSASREAFIGQIRGKTNIDFTPSNAYAITIWAIKYANTYFDKQMIDTFNKMVESANVINYQSNERVFTNNRYRYNEVNHTHFKLNYRMVLEHIGGISNSDYRYDSISGLSKCAANFLNDLIVVAANLGFAGIDYVKDHHFESRSQEVFHCKHNGEEIVLMEVRAFMNGNLHIRFGSSFMLALNVEVGRLMGWIHNQQHAASELDESLNEVQEYFKTNFTALPNTMQLLLN